MGGRGGVDRRQRGLPDATFRHGRNERGQVQEERTSAVRVALRNAAAAGRAHLRHIPCRCPSSTYRVPRRGDCVLYGHNLRLRRQRRRKASHLPMLRLI